MADKLDTVIALDVGERRIGVARATLSVGIANPLTTLERTERTMQDIQKMLDAEGVNALVVGLPRGLDGQETAQTGTIRKFVEQLTTNVNVPIILQDEALTSRKAEDELKARGKPYKKSDIDALAATYILEDYMQDRRQGAS